MIKEIVIDENYTSVGLFGQMKPGDIFKVPFDSSRHCAILSEASRQNRYARIRGELKSKIDMKFRVSSRENPGFTTIIRLK